MSIKVVPRKVEVQENTVTPILIGPKNCEPMTGVTWRWLREHAAGFGLEILKVDSKPFIVADAALEAIRRHGVVANEATENDEPEPEATIADLRAQLGMRRVAGGGR